MSSLSSPGLIKAANEALVALKPEINIIRQFAYDCSDAVMDYGLTVKVPIVSGGTAKAFNLSGTTSGSSPTYKDYENSTGTVTYATVTLNQQPVSTFEFVGKDVLEAPNAPYWTKCAEGGADSVGKYISGVIGGLITTSLTKVTMASVTKAALAGLRASCAGRVADTVLALAPDYFADALALFDSNVIGDQDPIRNGYIDRLYGFKSVIQLTDLPAGIKGALIPANGVAFASRAVGVGDEGAYSEFGTVSDENGFTLTVMRHGDPKTGKGFINITSLMGAALTQTDKTKYIAAS